MASQCAWFITVGDTQPLAQTAAAQLRPYGLPVQGQRWPQDQEQAWLASAQQAAQANAGVVLVSVTHEQYRDPALRRSLALFRLSLQTLLGRWVNGFILYAPVAAGTPDDSLSPTTTAVLDDWLPINDGRWPAKLVARTHAPIAPAWPARLGLHAHERLGVWLETHPAPTAGSAGAMAGVSGNGASISFHAAGPAGKLPERTVNEYALEGIQFDAGGHAFNAWALRNAIPPDHSYYVRLEGEPDALAIGDLPDGEPAEVSLILLR